MKNSREKIKKFISFSLAVSMTLTFFNIIPAKASESVKENELSRYMNKPYNLQFTEDKNLINNSNFNNKELTEEEAERDSDNDGLNDGLEQIFGCNPEKKDTDDDGLDDYLEIKLGLDPLSNDSDNDGVSDIFEDTDGDGLINLSEIKYGTDCTKKDTDSDGLSDGEEVYKYNTSPLLEDTDNDGLIDGDEIKLGLNPGTPYSDGSTNDNNREILQALSTNRISSLLLQDNSLFRPSLSGAVSGMLDKKVYIDEYNTSSLENSKGIAGGAIEIESLDDSDYKLNLSYDYTNFLKDNDESILDSLIICEDIDGKFVPLKTQNDSESNCLNAEITKPGVYFILDLEVFLDKLDMLPANMDVSLIPSCMSDGNEEAEYTAQDVNNNENSVLLDDYQDAKVDEPVSADNNVDSDGDGISDYDELGQKQVVDLSEFKDLLLDKKGLSLDSDTELEDDEEEESSVEVYQYASSPDQADTDFDGIDDGQDSEPKNNKFSGTLKTDFATSNVSYTMDYRNFFKGNTSYNSNISTISSLYSTVVYNGGTYNGLNITQFMSQHGLKNIKSYNLKDSYSDSDLSQAYIGHRKVTYNGVTKEIIAIVVRGTNSSIEEWESNFDIGSTSLKNKSPDWKISSNHKGFDAASTRLLKCLDEYENLGYLDSSAAKTYWVTGHSRGAAIANIMGARLIDSSKEVYAYTFAAPNTTTKSTAGNYTGIYNILNKDDFVPYLPMSAWGFKHYGKCYTVSIADNYEKEWESLTGIFDYNPDTLGMDDTISKLGGIMSTRNQAYVLSCKCHGDGSSDNITIRNYGTSKSSREKAIAKIPSNALPYCKITRYNGGVISGWDFTVCQEPEYFMQVLAAFMAGKINAYRFAVELNIADRYESAKTAIVKSGIGGLEHPHYPESYYLLSKHLS